MTEKGGKAKGKGKGLGPLTGCFICEGKLFARECLRDVQNRTHGSERSSSETQSAKVLCTFSEWKTSGSGNLEMFPVGWSLSGSDSRAVLGKRHVQELD